jgi:hypothetical protein
MKPSLSLAASLTALTLLVACGGQSPPAETAAATDALSASPEAAPCPDDGPRLPVTGICAGRAVNYVNPEIGLATETPEGCTWGFTETPLPSGDEAIVYRVLACKGVTTAFEFGAGAHSAALTYTASALQGDQAVGDAPIEPVRIFMADPADPQKVIRDLVENAPEAERAKCSVQAANAPGWPKDALVMQFTEAERAALSMDEPVSMCGPYGRDEDATAFWRIFGGYAWFFSLGQDTPDFDPGSFMLFTKGADGTWAPAA